MQSIRPKIETALSATAERLTPGSGSKVAHHAKNDLAVIDASSENLSKRYADADVALAVPAIFEAKHPDGDPVTIDKKHDGVIIAFTDSFIFVRGIGFGAREVKALSKNDVTVESISMILDGATVPGVRITGRGGKPHFAAAVTVEGGSNDPAAQAAVRDELVALLTS